MWDFIQNGIIGMQRLKGLIGVLLRACGLDTDKSLGGVISTPVPLEYARL